MVRLKKLEPPKKLYLQVYKDAYNNPYMELVHKDHIHKSIQKQVFVFTLEGPVKVTVEG